MPAYAALALRLRAARQSRQHLRYPPLRIVGRARIARRQRRGEYCCARSACLVREHRRRASVRSGSNPRSHGGRRALPAGSPARGRTGKTRLAVMPASASAPAITSSSICIDADRLSCDASAAASATGGMAGCGAAADWFEGSGFEGSGSGGFGSAGLSLQALRWLGRGKARTARWADARRFRPARCDGRWRLRVRCGRALAICDAGNGHRTRALRLDQILDARLRRGQFGARIGDRFARIDALLRRNGIGRVRRCGIRCCGGGRRIPSARRARSCSSLRRCTSNCVWWRDRSR